MIGPKFNKMCLTITSNAWNKKLVKKIPLWINLISSKLILSDAIAYNSTQCIKEIFTVNILAKSVWYPLDFQFPFITENNLFSEKLAAYLVLLGSMEIAILWKSMQRPNEEDCRVGQLTTTLITSTYGFLVSLLFMKV